MRSKVTDVVLDIIAALCFTFTLVFASIGVATVVQFVWGGR